MMKLRLLSAAALTAFMVAAAPAMTSQAAMFTTCVPVNNSGAIFNSGMFSGNFGQNGGQGSCGNFQMGGNRQNGSGLLQGGSCQNGNDCLTGGSCQNGNGCLTGGNCQNGNDCLTGGSCQNGSDCLSGISCQVGNSGNAGIQDGVQTLPSFGGMPVSFMPVSF